MNKNRVYILLSLSAFFGWLLSFPFSGPILYSLSQTKNIDAGMLGLIFTVFHAACFFSMGLILETEKKQKLIMLLSASMCLIINSIMMFIHIQYWYVCMAFMGALSAIYVLGWGYYYSSCISSEDRLKFMASVIMIANAVYYLVSILLPKVAPSTLLIIASISLVVSILAAIYIDMPDNNINANHQNIEPTNKLSFPSKLILVVFLFMFGVYLNGGFMYNAIYPFFSTFDNISVYYRTIPYVATLSLMYFWGQKTGRMPPIFFGISLLGMAFLSFAALGSTLTGYIVTETLVQSSFALFDIFLWVLIGDIASLYGKHTKVFGCLLFANVLPIFLGGLISRWFIEMGKTYPVITGLFAALIVFLVLLLIPVLNKCIDGYVDFKLVSRKVPENDEDKPIDMPKALHIPNIESLTPREMEIITLLMEGYSNKDIIKKLYISENTLKIHTRHIYQKINVSNRKELLKLALQLNKDIKPGQFL